MVVFSEAFFYSFTKWVTKKITHIHCDLFADDTCITLSDINYEKPNNNFNRGLSKFSYLFIQNRQSLNTEKTVTINFWKLIIQSESKLKLDEHTFDFVASTKCLAVFLDNKLSFSNQIDYTSLHFLKLFQIPRWRARHSDSFFPAEYWYSNKIFPARRDFPKIHVESLKTHHKYLHFDYDYSL